MAGQEPSERWPWETVKRNEITSPGYERRRYVGGEERSKFMACSFVVMYKLKSSKVFVTEKKLEDDSSSEEKGVDGKMGRYREGEMEAFWGWDWDGVEDYSPLPSSLRSFTGEGNVVRKACKLEDYAGTPVRCLWRIIIIIAFSGDSSSSSSTTVVPRD
ncbi:unnamed protein product [Calypogeia fissa]